MRKGFVYIVSNKNRTTFYIGVTSDIKRRILEHKTGEGSVFTHKYNLVDLMYYEKIEGMDECISREKQLKNWHRDWKLKLIRESNPEMKDLAADWYIRQDGKLVDAEDVRAKAFFEEGGAKQQRGPDPAAAGQDDDVDEVVCYSRTLAGCSIPSVQRHAELDSASVS